MRYLLTILLVPCLSFSISAQSNNNKEAADFFLKVVKTYFDKDCDTFYSFFGDSTTIVSPDGVELISSKEIIDNRKACEKFEGWIKGISSFHEYLISYRVGLLEWRTFTYTDKQMIDIINKQIEAENTDNTFIYEILRTFNAFYSDTDYFVFGNTHKSDASKNLSDGLFWFIVRKTKDGWKIFGTPA